MVAFQAMRDASAGVEVKMKMVISNVRKLRGAMLAVFNLNLNFSFD